MAGAHASPASIAAAPKQPIHPHLDLVISIFHVLTAHRPFSSIIVPRLFESNGTTFSIFLLDTALRALIACSANRNTAHGK
jgi:hypothetical protein